MTPGPSWAVARQIVRSVETYTGTIEVTDRVGNVITIVDKITGEQFTVTVVANRLATGSALIGATKEVE